MEQLAPELLNTIFEHVEDEKTLQFIACSCSGPRAYAESRLYANFFHRTAGRWRQFLDALEVRPERAKAMRSIDSWCKFNRADGFGFRLSDVIIKSTKLEHLVLESPYCNHCYKRARNRDEEWRHVLPRNFRPIYDPSCGLVTNSMPNLKSLRFISLELAGGEILDSHAHSRKSIHASRATRFHDLMYLSIRT